MSDNHIEAKFISNKDEIKKNESLNEESKENFEPRFSLGGVQINDQPKAVDDHTMFTRSFKAYKKQKSLVGAQTPIPNLPTIIPSVAECSQSNTYESNYPV